MWKTYRDSCSTLQEKLKTVLTKEEIPEITINNILESGFYLLDGIVIDGYYGNRSGIYLKQFIRYLKNEIDLTLSSSIPTYEINSINDAKKILEEPQYKKFIDDLCFRGQTSHYVSKRPFPHPTYANKNGEEILLIPGIWRNYLDTNNHVSNDRPYNPPASFLNLIKNRLIYHNFDQKRLRKTINIKDGRYYYSDFEDDKEAMKRYLLEQDGNFSFTLIEQHYGVDTIGLDVTFDIKTALFFATHKFNLSGSKASYSPIKNNNTGLVYILRFSSPKLIKSRDKINKIDGWDHLYPSRPIKQECALPSFHSFTVNEAVPHIVGILKIGNEFDFSDSYNQSELFPNKDNDAFYKVLLDLKKEFPEELNKIFDYNI